MRSIWVNAALSATLLATLVAAVGCSGAEDDGSDVQAFQPPGAGAPPGSVTPPAAAPAPGDTPGITTPAPSQEAPPPVAGIDTGSGTPAANGGTPAPSAPAPTAPADPNAPVTPPAPGVSGATASAGCALAQGAPQNPTTIADPNTIVTFPQGYDGSTPKPLVFAFHGAGRTNVDMRTVDSRTANSPLEAAFVMAYVKSAGNAWDPNTDHPRFSAVLEQLETQFCIDTAHVFAFGHSSGAQFIVQILGSPNIREQRFAGVVEVASSRYNNPAWDPLPTLVIHGLNDNQRPGDNNGANDIVQRATSARVIRRSRSTCRRARRLRTRPRSTPAVCSTRAAPRPRCSATTTTRTTSTTARRRTTAGRASRTRRSSRSSSRCSEGARRPAGGWHAPCSWSRRARSLRAPTRSPR